MKDFQRFSTTVSERLLSWSGFSMGCGGRLLQSESPFWRGIGLHFLAWGAIDALIALAGLNQTARKLGREEPFDPAAVHQEAGRLERLLWLNSGLDLLYLWGGWRLYKGKGEGDAGWRGQGVGIMIQGGFLLLFDLFHALLLVKKKPSFTQR